MDKLKKIFSPGADKDDEVLYGDEAARKENAAKTTEEETQKLHTTEEGHKKDHSILKQIFNPGGDKHDAQRFGETATTQSPDPKLLQTHPEHKDHTIARQIFNPDGDKYDEERFGATAATSGTTPSDSTRPAAPAGLGADTILATDAPKKEHSILRQIINPHGDNYDNQAYGTTAHAISESEHKASTSAPAPKPDHSIVRQILNPGQEKYDPVVHGSSVQHQDQSLTDRTVHTSSADNAQTDRDTAVAGGAGALGVVAVAANEGKQPGVTANEGIVNRSHPVTDRTAGTQVNPIGASVVPPSETTTDSPLFGDTAVAGGAGAVVVGAGTHIHSQDSSKITDRPHPLGGHDIDTHINPINAPEAPEPHGSVVNTADIAGASTVHNTDYDRALGSGSAASSSHVSRDAAAVGGAAAGGAAVSQLNQAPTDVQNATFTERAYPVGGLTSHHTIDPNPTRTVDVGHVPGEFPNDEGTNIHGLNPAHQPAISSEKSGTSAPAPTPSTGLGATAGAAGIGGVSSIDHGAPTQRPVESSITQPGIQEHSIQTITNTLPSGPTETQGHQHEYGRDAAVAGGAGLVGAGLVGAGAYAATQSGQGTGPASRTIGPHESNIANVVDPNVKPDLEQQRGHEITGPHYTELANKLDPRVDATASTGTTGITGTTGTTSTTGPASKTVGPHESNLANIADPSVKPNLDAQRGHETTGPHNTDLANKADPRVESDPAKVAAQRAAEQHAEDSSGPNKLQKPHPDHAAGEGEKKPSLIQRILHPGHKSDDNENRVTGG